MEEDIQNYSITLMVRGVHFNFVSISWDTLYISIIVSRTNILILTHAIFAKKIQESKDDFRNKDRKD